MLKKAFLIIILIYTSDSIFAQSNLNTCVVDLNLGSWLFMGPEIEIDINCGTILSFIPGLNLHMSILYPTFNAITTLIIHSTPYVKSYGLGGSIGLRYFFNPKTIEGLYLGACSIPIYMANEPSSTNYGTGSFIVSFMAICGEIGYRLLLSNDFTITFGTTIGYIPIIYTTGEIIFNPELSSDLGSLKGYEMQEYMEITLSFGKAF